MSKKRKNLVAEEWSRTLADYLNNNMLMATPLGKTNFACGVGFVLGWLRHHPADWQRLYDDLEAFIKEYMAESEAMKARDAANPYLQEFRDKWIRG